MLPARTEIGVVQLEVNAVLGAVRIVTPEGRPVVIEGAPILGKFSGPDGGATGGAPVVVRGAAALGFVRVGPPTKQPAV